MAYTHTSHAVAQLLAPFDGRLARERVAAFDARPAASVWFRDDATIDFELDTYHWLVDRTVYDARLSEVFRRWRNRGDNLARPLPMLVAEFPAWLADRCPKMDLRDPYEKWVCRAGFLLDSGYPESFLTTRIVLSAAVQGRHTYAVIGVPATNQAAVFFVDGTIFDFDAYDRGTVSCGDPHHSWEGCSVDNHWVRVDPTFSEDVLTAPERWLKKIRPSGRLQAWTKNRVLYNEVGTAWCPLCGKPLKAYPCP